MRIIVKATETEVVTWLVEQVITNLGAALKSRGRASLVVAGGKTFEPVYRLLREVNLDWPKIDLFFGDERCVGPEHEWSNFRLLHTAWLDAYSVGKGPLVHRIQGEIEGIQAAQNYAAELYTYGGQELPIFDLVLLGFGPDGHTASLFPQNFSPMLACKQVVAKVAAGLPPLVDRITMTPRVLCRSRATIVAGTGEAKAAIVARLSQDSAKLYPLSHIESLFGEKVMILDQKAASKM